MLDAFYAPGAEFARELSMTRDARGFLYITDSLDPTGGQIMGWKVPVLAREA